MTTEDLLRRVAAQPVVTVERTVHMPGPELQALFAEGTPILLTELTAHPDQHPEIRTFRYAHLLGPGLSYEAIAAWQAAHHGHRLPPDLAGFLERVNGVHLWADLASSRAYFGILPLEEWQDVRDTDWAMMFESPPAGQLAISYHENGDDLLVLDTNGPEYLWYDLEDFDNPRCIGSTVAELLDFWWEETAWLDPRRGDEAG
jgi:SMI1/KNR4 family protein SUKH-1